LSAIRQLADIFLECSGGRKKSPAFEARWLNLAGFCLRPGFGFPGDDFRVEQTRASMRWMQHANRCSVRSIGGSSGRIAGGLNRNQQWTCFNASRLPAATRGKSSRG